MVIVPISYEIKKLFELSLNFADVEVEGTLNSVAEDHKNKLKLFWLIQFLSGQSHEKNNRITGNMYTRRNVENLQITTMKQCLNALR